MKLRSLQIKGFKSFANDTVINFNDEIIGIVGPNGSGKSNIVDAIRWVLGEQKSKELRLEKMVDVIFNGTKSKKKAGMAQVSMTFDNSKKLIPLEFDQVKVSRILYSNNESEYRINDVTCRLKDIRNLFLDTGIGSNSYAIIELGMVDDILSDKDNARRKMFEQGAGIAKYKTRKRETILKLNSAQGDLDRVDDILFELQANLKKFEKQAKRTKKYYELKEKYKELSIQKAVVSQSEAIKKEADLKSNLGQHQGDYTEITNKVHTLEADIEKTKKAHLDSEQLLNHQQKEFSELIDVIRKSEGKQDMLVQNESFIQKNIQRVTNNKTSFSSKFNELTAEANTKQAAVDELLSQSENLETRFLSWKSKFDEIENRRKDIQGENSSDLDELKELEDKRFSLEKSVIELNSSTTNLNNNKTHIEVELQSIDVEIATLKNKIAKSNTELEGVNSKIENLNKEKAELALKKQEIESQIEDYNSQLLTLNRTIDAQTNELKLLEDMMNNLEGFPESSKFLFKEWKVKKPLLADIIDCKDEYRNALESFLEPYLNYFVLDDIEQARESINLLKNAQRGKSKFFILSSFSETQSNEVLLYDHLGEPALGVIKYEKKYEGLMQHLLGNVVIVDNEKVLSRNFPSEDVIYISPTGESKRTRHTVTGGSIGLFDGKRIGRQQVINDLKKSLTEGKEQVTKIEGELTQANEELSKLNIVGIEEQIDTCITEKNKVDIELAQYNTIMSSLESRKQAEKSRIDEFLNLTSSNQHQILNFKSDLQLIVSSIATKKDTISSQSGIIEEIAKDFGEISSHFNNAQLEWVQHQNTLSTLQKELEFITDQISELKEKTSEADTEITNLNAEFKTTQEGLETVKKELIDSYAIRDEKQKALGDTENSFFTKREVVTEKEERLKKLNKALQDSQLKVNNLKDELKGIEFELRSSMDRLMIEFNIDIKSISHEEVLSEIEDIPAVLEAFEKVKRRLDNYGEINPMAVEAYDEILERFESMEAQKNDILEAKASLLETIKEIDSDATEKFMTAFHKVRENFKEVFRSLFSAEDDCDLILFDTEDPLNSGIEIIAKPKGKRPKVLNQLSGGEKTLTATALLFSLYLLKPAPFCIFDEVDAPLDDLNIQKFSKLIRRFADASQFIVITHNKSTMANMDLLYGVYMQEQGISGITQVDFREYEHSEVFQTVNMN